MTERGFIALARGVMDHPLVGAKKPYTHYAAWHWLLFEAAWKSRRYLAGPVVVNLGRGQLAHSVRYMATAWGWSIGSVQRFLTRLKTDTMIDTATDTGLTVITICNYETYQTPTVAPDTASDTPSDTKTIQERYRKEQGNQSKQVPTANAASPSSDPKTQLYQRGVELLGENSGGIVTDLLKAKGTVPAARSALEAADGKGNPREYIGGIIKHTKARAIEAGGLAYDSAL